MVKIVECDAEESVAFRSSLWVWASEEVGIALEHSLAVGAFVILEGVVAMGFASHRKPFD